MRAVDIYRSSARTLALFLGSCGFAAACAWIILAHSGSGDQVATRGSFRAFEMYLGLVFFGFGAIVWGSRLRQHGPVVSVGPRGIYDRRLSTDWIPWAAIRAVKPTRVLTACSYQLEIDPEADADLPWTRQARFVSGLNRMFGRRYWIGTAELTGGFPALAEVIGRNRPLP